jgi:O-antigen/teichoic acid export membrane protein
MEIVVAPMLSASFHGGRLDEFKSILHHSRKWILAPASFVFLLMMFWPKPILLLFGPQYGEASLLLQILACGQFVNAMTGPVGYALLLTGKERLAIALTLLVAVVNLLINVMAISKWGALGAAVATTSAS